MLDPQVERLRSQRVLAQTPPLYTLSVEEARVADLAAARTLAGKPEPVAAVEEITIPGPARPLAARVYRPADGVLPTLVYFFGGGWVVGTLDTADGICRALANQTPCLAISASYRLAPEDKFRAAVEDAYAATRWVADNVSRLGGDPTRIAVGGDSAGGNLAAAVALIARDRGGPPLSFQLLFYPVLDYMPDNASMRENIDPAFFNRESMAWYWKHYLSDESDGRNPLAAPARAKSLAALPPAYIVTAERDPLRDEGEKYARRLRDAGVAADVRRYPGMIHGFIGMGGAIDAATQALDTAAARLRTALASPLP